MVTAAADGWSGLDMADWADLGRIRARLDAGADPDARAWADAPVLHAAAEYGSPEVVAELARRAREVDAESEGRTALWVAVFTGNPGNARALAEAGADPWRPMMSGWSPGQLALAGPDPDLFPLPPGQTGLSEDEAAAVAQARRMTAALGDPADYDGTGLACIAGIDAAEAARRLEATPLTDTGPGSIVDDPRSHPSDQRLEVVGATDVPGGCIITQPWGYAPQMPGVMARLTPGTVGYGLYHNPKSGSQGCVYRDGVVQGWDLHPGGDPIPEDPPFEVLLSYLYRYDSVGFSCAYAGLRPADARAVTGPADLWLRLPRLDHWS